MVPKFSLKDTHPQLDTAHGGKQRSFSSESSHETSIRDSMKKKKKKKHERRKSADRSPAPRAISFSMHQVPDSMVKDYNWMLTDAAGDAAPDQSNPRFIIIDEMPEGVEISHHDQMLGNPFTGPGKMVAVPYGHGGALPPDRSHESSDGGAQKEEFCTMVQTLEGIVPFSTVTADNDPHSEVLSGGNFDIPKGGYPAPYVLEGFQGLFIPKPGAPGILTCGYH